MMDDNAIPVIWSAPAMQCQVTVLQFVGQIMGPNITEGRYNIERCVVGIDAPSGHFRTNFRRAARAASLMVEVVGIELAFAARLKGRLVVRQVAKPPLGIEASSP